MTTESVNHKIADRVQEVVERWVTGGAIILDRSADELSLQVHLGSLDARVHYDKAELKRILRLDRIPYNSPLRNSLNTPEKVNDYLIGLEAQEAISENGVLAWSILGELREYRNFAHRIGKRLANPFRFF